MTEHNVNGVVFRTADRFSAAGGVIHGFSTRLGGVSQGVWATMNLGTTRGDDPACVTENYRRFFEATGASMDKLVMSNQVHGTDIRTVTEKDYKRDHYAPEGYDVDGLITHRSGEALVIFSADCLPVLLYDPKKRVICAIHAGWRGTAAGIAPKAVERMTADYGCRKEDILAAVGPGISRCHFETDGDVPQALRQAIGPRAEACLVDHGTGKFHVDIKAANRLLLVAAGLKDGNITMDEDCTYCHPEKYWSHRKTGWERGSQATVIQLT